MGSHWHSVYFDSPPNWAMVPDVDVEKVRWDTRVVVVWSDTFSEHNTVGSIP